MPLDSGDVATALFFLGAGWFIWKFVYFRNKFLGNIFFFSMGIGAMYFFVSAGEREMVFMGLIIMIGSLINMFYDLLKK